MKEHYLVTKDNKLIEARQKKPLSAREQKIILTMASMIEPKDEEFKDYTISVKEFHDMLHLNGRANYSQIKDVVDELMSKVVEIPSESANGGWVKTHWVSRAEYINGSGVIQLRFAPDLKPYLIQLKDTFTSYRLSNILSLNSGYSIRLYELMKKWQFAHEWTCSVENLREKLSVEPGKYPRYANFNAKILKVAVSELNEKTDLTISVKEIKEKRNVVKLTFTIKSDRSKNLPEPKPEPEKPKTESDVESMRNRLNQKASGYSFDTTFFLQLHQAASLIWNESVEQELTWLIDYVNAETSIKNPLGFIKSKIKSAWEIHEVGQPITFEDLRPVVERHSGRQEKLPDWFKSNDQPTEAPAPNPKLDDEKAAVLKKLAANKQRIADANKKN